jgi:DNA-binding transcriptional LysR family regulator
MLESVSLDQLRMFVAAADTGSFSAAARQVDRAQSAVSQAIATLEGVLGVRLFDRSERYPRLTNEGVALLATARRIVSDTDALKAHARNLAGDLEPELSVVFDVMFPQQILTDMARAFAQAFPVTPLRIYIEALGAVAQSVLDRRCSLGVIGTLQKAPVELVKEWVFGVPFVTVVAPEHPLASFAGRIPTSLAEQHVHVVITDRSALSEGREFGVLGGQSWRVADLSTKHALLCAGLGWGHMPLPSVAEDIARGRLVVVTLEGEPTSHRMPMWAVFRSDAQPGRAGRWLVEYLKQLADDDRLKPSDVRPAAL